MAFTDDQEREFIEQVACQCWRDELVLDVEHNDTRAWETLPDVDRELYIEQAEYWTKLLRYFELRAAAEDVLYEFRSSVGYMSTADERAAYERLKVALKHFSELKGWDW